jgi:RecT family
MTNQSLQRIDKDEWGVLREQATMLVQSGFMPPSIKTPENAIAVILMGRELGITPMASLQTINIIQNKPTISPQLMLALINRSGQLEDIKMESNSSAATCMMKRKGRHPHTVKFGKEEAQALQLSGKDNYKKQPGTMFQWRAVAMCARVVFPDVILGLYTPDEMGAETDMETGIPLAEPLQIETSEDAELDHSINLVYSELVDLRVIAMDTNPDLKPLPDLTSAVNYKYRVTNGLDSLGTEQKKELFASLLKNRDQEEAAINS